MSFHVLSVAVCRLRNRAWRAIFTQAIAAILGASIATGAIAAQTPPAKTPTVPGVTPHMLWIPGVALGSGKSAQVGAWLLMGADNKPLRGPDIRSVQNYVVLDGEILPAAASDASGKFGYLDKAGQWALTPQFEEAKAFTRDGLARVKRNGLWGFLGTDLSVRIPHQYAQANAFANGMAAVMVKNKWGFIDTKGTLVVPTKYRMVWRYGDNGLARVAVGESKYGFIDKKGNMVIAPQLDLALEFGASPVTVAQSKDLWGVLDGEGRWVSKPSFKRLNAFQEPGLAAFEPNYRETGYIDTTGKVAIAPGPLSQLIRQGLILHGNGGGTRYQFVDTQGKTAIAGPFEWTHDFPVERPWVVARRKGEWGLVLRSGAWVAAGPGREPLLVDSDENTSSRNLSMWLHAAHAIEWKDAQGRTLYRLSPRPAEAGKTAVWQLHAEDRLVWTSAPQKGDLLPLAFFEPGVADVTKVPGNDWVGVSKQLLAKKSQPYLPYSLVFEDRRDAYDLKSVEDEDDLERVQTGAFAVLAQTYVSETQWGEYYFLSEQRYELFKTLRSTICTALRGAYGPALNDGPKSKQASYDNDLLCAWKLGNKTLSVTRYDESGDGDFEHQIRMSVQ